VNKKDDNLSAAYGKAIELTEIAKRNPRVGNLAPRDRVNKYVRRKDERGSPEPVSRVTRDRHSVALQDFLEDRGIANLPTLGDAMKSKKPASPQSEIGNPNTKTSTYKVGGPKEDLKEISGQLTKASNLHARQSDRVGKIAKKMK
tara:strand:- start:6123 stop:6557 length:435 start_codon:yes stop_codon:yes gene_type:complete